jgi:Na+-driven multidrug efflux pump
MVGVAIGAGLVQRARQVAWTGSTLAALMIGVVGMLLDFAFASLQRMVTYVE